jgi:hypothetical protein
MGMVVYDEVTTTATIMEDEWRQRGRVSRGGGRGRGRLGRWRIRPALNHAAAVRNVGGSDVRVDAKVTRLGASRAYDPLALTGPCLSENLYLNRDRSSCHHNLLIH